MPENRKLKVFLCHSKDDKPKVRELYRRLVADGFDTWLDEEKLMPGQDWDLEIRKAVRESDVVVVCLSNGSVTKAGYVQKEIRFALDVADEQPEGTIFIIPARLEDCPVPSRLTQWHWVNLFEIKGLEKLILPLNVRAVALGIDISILEPHMIHIPNGNFLMGSTLDQIELRWHDYLYPDEVDWEQPQHKVLLSDYFISKYPVTNREYFAFIRDSKNRLPRGWNGEKHPVGKDNHPVVNVSCKDAKDYCDWLARKSGKPYRLPTEAEWEKAARGEDSLIWPWGNEFDKQKANTSEAGIGGTTPVGQFSPYGDSPYGCVDMAGNVWEWCSDWFDENQYKRRASKIVKNKQSSQGEIHNVLRGGSFNESRHYAGCAVRSYSWSNEFLANIGFRVAFSPKSEGMASKIRKWVNK